MSNRKSIQILRGAEGFDPSVSDEILLDGQPFYSKKNKKLYIGDGVTELKYLQGTDIGLNLENDTGTSSISQKNGGVTNSSGTSIVADAKATGKSATAFGVRTEAIGDASLAAGYNAKAYGKGDIAFNLASAGIKDVTEFNSIYPDGYNLSGEILDFDAYKLRVTNGAFACGGGIAKGTSSFSAGSQSGTGSYGDRSATFGEKTKTTISAKNSLAGGISTTLGNSHSIAYGRSLSAPSREFPTAVFGQFNKSWHDDEGEPSYQTIFEIGNGIDDDNKSNAFSVLFDGRAKVFGAPKYSNDVLRLVDLKLYENGSLNTDNKTIIGAINEISNLNIKNGSGSGSINTVNGKATGTNSASFGLQNSNWTAAGGNSLTLGAYCKTGVNAHNSVSGGNYVAVHTPNTIAYGSNLTAGGQRVVFGQWNTNNSANILEIGNGVSGSPSNAFEILWDGRARVKTAPIEGNDVVRYQDIESLLKLIEGLDEAKITALNKFAKSLSEEA